MHILLWIFSASTFISTSYSPALIILCLALGVGYAFLLYRKDKQLGQIKSYLRKILFGLRTLAVSIIAFLLLSPVINTEGEYTEEASVLFLQDVSESVKADSTDFSTYRTQIKSLSEKLETNFQTKQYSYGEYLRDSIDYRFADKQTNISEALEGIQARSFNRNVGALVLAGDGIYNSGSNPIYLVSQMNVPVYTIAMGSTQAQNDLILSDVQYNKMVFLNDIYPLRIAITAHNLKDKNSRLRVYDNGKLIAAEPVNISQDDFYKVIDLEVKAEKSGVHRIRFVLDAIDGEFSTQNNLKEILFEVIDGKQKVLLLANAPHPDVAAIRSALDKNKNFETDFAMAGNLQKPLSAYNLVIMHQLPSVQNSVTAELQAIRQHQIPVLWVLGKQSSLQKFNSIGTGLTIMQQANTSDGATGILNENFSLFELMPETHNLSQNAPPLETPFGKYTGFSNNNVLFFRNIKGINTETPLMVFNNHTGNSTKNAVITGEGLWRWKLYDYKMNQNHILFNEWIQKSCRYLSLKVNKERFRVETEAIVAENAEVFFKAERYNKSYELINDEPVSLVLRDSSDAEFQYTFGKSRQSYEINIGRLAPGDYKWIAKTRIDDKPAKKIGSISIRSINIEAQNTQANHNLLYNISEQTGGKMLMPENAGELIEILKNSPRMKPIIHTEKKNEKMAQAKWLFFLIITLLISEWFIRKYSGAY